jgi:hypothetical protein
MLVAAQRVLLVEFMPASIAQDRSPDDNFHRFKLLP